MNIQDKFDLLVKQFEELTRQVRELTDIYQKTILKDWQDILKETRNLKSFIEEALENVLREVVGEAIKNMKTQPNVYHEVEVPVSIKQKIIEKSLDSPNCLIHSVLHREASGTEIIYALASIRERQRLRGRLHD